MKITEICALCPEQKSRCIPSPRDSGERVAEGRVRGRGAPCIVVGLAMEKPEKGYAG